MSKAQYYASRRERTVSLIMFILLVIKNPKRNRLQFTAPLLPSIYKIPSKPQYFKLPLSRALITQHDIKAYPTLQEILFPITHISIYSSTQYPQDPLSQKINMLPESDQSYF